MWNRGGNARTTGTNEAPLGASRRGWGNDSQAPSNQQDSRDQRGGGGDQRGGAGYGQDRNQQSNYGQEGNYGRDSRDDRSGGGVYRGDDRGNDRGGGYGGERNERGRQEDRPSYDRPNQHQSSQAPPDRYSDRPQSSWDQPSAPPAPEIGDGERKRKSRWGAAQAVGGMPTAITGGVQSKDLESYAVQLRLDEIQRALRSGLVVPPDGARSPSPPPTYDSHGRRMNTRDVRYRKKLEDERMRLVERQVKMDPNFKPPTEYLMQKGRGGRPTDKVYIPVKDYPEINFFGLLVGPRGNTLKTMERESGAKISIRGKGSVKEGKGRPGGGFDDDENDELHCLVTADTEEKVQRCVKLIGKVIETAASVPEGQNDHKRSQLRELATLNGTLRDDENQVCQNCGGVGHRKYDCPEQKNWTAGIICRTCGGAGHMARDCTQKPGRPGFPQQQQQQQHQGGFGQPGAPIDQGRAQQFDSEYASLMAELGETSSTAPLADGQAPPTGGHVAPWNGGGPTAQLDENGEKIPPWRIPSNWTQSQQQSNRPQMGGNSYGGQGAYTGTSQGYSSFPQANYSAAQQNGGGGYPQQGSGYPQQGGGYPQQGGYGGNR